VLHLSIIILISELTCLGLQYLQTLAHSIATWLP